MIEQLTALMVHSGASWVLWSLFALSFLSVAVACERAVVFRRVRCNVARLIPELRRQLREGGIPAALRLLAHDHHIPARVVTAGLAESDLGAEAAEEAMMAAIGLERARLEQHLLFLGTVGNNAPFVGLLGTVIGIVGAFAALSQPQAGVTTALAPERVMSTIAEALVATAVGLIVAIPAVAAFNYFQGRVATAVANSEALGHVLLAHLKGVRQAAPAALRVVGD